MEYSVGDIVVYPRHGAAVVEEITSITLRDVTRQYLVLTAYTDGRELKIKVPVESVKSVGVREIVDEDAVAQVFEILRTPIVEDPPKNWSRRYKQNVEKIASGEVNAIAEVVRDLSQRDFEIHGLSAGEKRMLFKARSILTSEIALSEHISEELTQHLIDVNLGFVPIEAGDENHYTQKPIEPASETLARVEREQRALGKNKRVKKQTESSEE